MSADDLISYISDAGFVFIFGAVAIDAVRRPLRTSFMAAAFFGILAFIVSLSFATRVTGATLPSQLSRIDAGLLMVMPCLLLFIAADFGHVNRVAMWAATAGMTATALSVIVVPLTIGSWYVIAILGYFVVVASYATWCFLLHALHSQGVTHRRMQAVAWGSGFLALAIAFAACNSALPAYSGVWTAATRVAALLCAACYFVGFAPPRSLRRVWQDKPLRAFLNAATNVPLTADLPDVMSVLTPAIAETVGAPRALIALWNEADQRLAAPRFPPLPDSFRRNSSVAARVFESQRPVFIADAAKADPDNAEVYQRFNATALLIAPITDGQRRFGVVSAYADRASVFALEDLALLETLASEVAGFLHRRELVEAAASVRAQEESTQLKDEFLAAAAHDLRTPLTVILGQAQLMQRRLRTQPEAPLDGEGIARIASEASRMRQLTEDLLDISHAEGGTFIGRRTPTDLVALAEEIAAAARARSAYHRFAIEGSEVYATVDRNRMAQVLANLVDNATKFSPTGGDVTITITEVDGDAHLIVSDQGIGIPPADLEAIFLRFRRGSSEDMQRFAGTGVGLFLCKRIVDEHGGRIWAESDSEGSRLHVVLPVHGE